MDKEAIAQSLVKMQGQILGLEQSLAMLRDGKVPADPDMLNPIIQLCASWGVSLAAIAGKILLAE